VTNVGCISRLGNCVQNINNNNNNNNKTNNNNNNNNKTNNNDNKNKNTTNNNNIINKNNNTTNNNIINKNNNNIQNINNNNNTQNNNNNECRTFNRISVARIFCQCTPNCIEIGNESESSFDESGNKSDSNFIVKCNLPKPENTRSVADRSAAVARVPVFCQFIPFL
jgi:hypothetical protein